jgi:hypothetical protein
MLTAEKMLFFAAGCFWYATGTGQPDFIHVKPMAIRKRRTDSPDNFSYFQILIVLHFCNNDNAFRDFVNEKTALPVGRMAG